MLGSCSLLLSALGMGRDKGRVWVGKLESRPFLWALISGGKPGSQVTAEDTGPPEGWEREHLNHPWPLLSLASGQQSTSIFFFNSIYSLNQQTLGYQEQSKLSSLNKDIHHSSWQINPWQWQINPWQRNSLHWLGWDIIIPGWFS